MSEPTPTPAVDAATTMSDPFALRVRPRRLRRHAGLRTALRRVKVDFANIIAPVFVTAGTGVKKPVLSMPGVHQMSVDVACDFLDELSDGGLTAYLAFGVIERDKKNTTGGEALSPDNPVCALVRETRRRGMPLLAITDLCLCEYTDHGHCGQLTPDCSTVDNDATLELLVRQAVNHAGAGAQVVAPSGAIDGMVGAIRSGLDSAGFDSCAILSYSVKYASAFYGPFRDAADSAPVFGDRHGYQMDPARGVEEALHEVELDLEQSADMVMVKPAGAYLDIIAAVRARVNVPVVAYQTSGEYAMLQAAGANGWIDRERAIVESLTAIKRAGADLIVSYFAPELVRLLKS